ncbi:MAG: peptidoglycan DD-metalloendopeptidase family protein [Clostridiales bacterium]|nr:peptidoglycan DD-metalloendopeptidase family protein [Clostridiales bacterium]
MKRILCILLLTVMVLVTNTAVFAVDSLEEKLEKYPTATKMEYVNEKELPIVFDSANMSDMPYIIVSYKWKSDCSNEENSVRIFHKYTGEEQPSVQNSFTLSLGEEYTFTCQYENNQSVYSYNGDLVIAASDTGSYVGLENIIFVANDYNVSSKASVITKSAGTKNESEPNNTFSTATITSDDYDNYGTISSTSDVDWWKITFNRSGYANFWLGNIPSNCNYNIALYDSTGTNLLYYSYKSGNADELISMCPVSAATYYIKIFSASGSSTTSRYHMRIKWYPFVPDIVYTIKNVAKGEYLTIKDACNASDINLTYSYAYITTNTSNDAKNNGQRMRINYDASSSFYTIAPTCSYNGQHRVLDVYDGLSSSSRRIWTYQNNGAEEEHFVFEKQADNSYIISFKNNSNYVLDVDANKNVYANTRNGNSSQRWILTEDTNYNNAERTYRTYNWSWPLSNNFRLSSSFGYRYVNGYKFHNGIDIPADNKTSVYCPTQATYSNWGYDRTYGCGYYLVIETSNKVYNSSQNIKLLFQHLYEDAKTTNSNIEVGNNISKGAVIAKTGDTGTSGSYHLHYTVITDGSDVFVNGSYSHRSFSNTEQPLMFYPYTTLTYN